MDFPEIIAITNKLNMSGAKAVQSGQSTTKSGVINPILMIRQGEHEFRLNKNYQNKEIGFQKNFNLTLRRQLRRKLRMRWFIDIS